MNPFFPRKGDSLSLEGSPHLVEKSTRQSIRVRDKTSRKEKTITRVIYNMLIIEGKIKT